MLRRLVLPVLAAGVVLATAAAHAQVGGSQVLRQQSRAVQRAVQKQSEIIVKPQLRVAEDATGPVTALALTPDERFLLTAVGDNSVRLWDLNAGREVAALKGHDSRVHSVAVAPGGKTAATMSEDLTLRLWNLKSLETAATLSGGYATSGRAVAFTGNGRWLVLGRQDGDLEVRDRDDNLAATTADGHDAGFTVIARAGGGDRVLAADRAGRIALWAVGGAPRAVRDLESPEGVVTDLSVAAAAGRAAGATEAGTVVVWDLETGAIRHRFGGHEGHVTSVGLHPERGIAVSGGADGTVRVWPLDGGDPYTLGSHDATVSYARVDEAGTLALSGSADGTTRLWHLDTKSRLLSLISTTDGWAVVDSKGRFEGSADALDGIEWASEKEDMPIEQFTGRYYQPALIPATLEDPAAEADVKAIREGIHLPPNVRFVSPESDTEADSDEMIVEVLASDRGGSGVQDLRLFQNGKRVSARAVEATERGEAEDGGPRVVKRYRLTLTPGDNVLSAVAVNDEALESSPRAVMVRTDAAETAPRLHLLTVGVNKYADPDLNLNYATPDAKALRTFFADRKTELFSQTRSTRVTNSAATRKGILDAFERLRRAPPRDVAVIYMAGHGLSIAGRWYFLPHEVVPTSPRAVREKALSVKDLKRHMHALGPDRVFLVIDSCKSGTAVSPLKDYKGLKALRMLSRTVGVHILAATDRDQYAVELDSLGHGVVTYALLEALRGRADRAPRDGAVDVMEAMRFVEATVPRLSRRAAKYTQYPTATSRGTDFPLVLDQ